MNAASITIAAIVLLLAALAVWRCLKKGAPCECGGSCCDCGCKCNRDTTAGRNALAPSGSDELASSANAK